MKYKILFKTYSVYAKTLIIIMENMREIKRILFTLVTK